MKKRVKKERKMQQSAPFLVQKRAGFNTFLALLVHFFGVNLALNCAQNRDNPMGCLVLICKWCGGMSCLRTRWDQWLDWFVARGNRFQKSVFAGTSFAEMKNGVV